MNQEQERKWLVDSLPEDLGKGDFIQQAHIVVTEERDVRLRARKTSGGESKRTLTIKKGTGESREEYDTEITLQQYWDLDSGVEGTEIEKRRHEMEIGDHTAEIDVYQGDLEGLAVVEVEDPDGFEPPEWFGAEVTEDERYKNKWLAVKGIPTTPVEKRRPIDE
jgi:CYTH domain-containing protein